MQVFPLYQGVHKMMYGVGFPFGYEERRVMDETLGIGAFGVDVSSVNPTGRMVGGVEGGV